MGVDNGSSIVVGASRSVLSPHELLARALRGPEHAPRSAAKELPLALRRGWTAGHPQGKQDRWLLVTDMANVGRFFNTAHVQPAESGGADGELQDLQGGAGEPGRLPEAFD